MKILLTDLSKHKELIGKRFNMKRQGGKYHYDYQNKPLMRIFQSAKVKKEKGVKWITWYWEAESTLDQFDCGYSGINLTSEFHKGSYLEV